MEKVVSELHLGAVVAFKGYADNISGVDNDAQIFGLTSRMEGFDLAIMEAISYGVIGITYDVNYGPNDIILDSQNGYVVKYGDYTEMAAKMVQVLQNKDLLQELSNGAYQSSQRYSSSNIWKLWDGLLEDAKQDLGGDVK